MTVSLLGSSDPVVDEEPHHLFRLVFHCLISDYAGLRGAKQVGSLTVRNVGLGFDSAGASWLALDPSVAAGLGWCLADEGLFRWVDSEGKTMVESIWWIDGHLESASWHSRDEVAEGWLVIAFSDAWNAIRSEFGDMKQLVSVERRRGGYEGSMKRAVRSQSIAN